MEKIAEESFQRESYGDLGLELIVRFLDRAVDYAVKPKTAEPEMWGSGPIDTFCAIFSMYRNLGVAAINHLNSVLAGKAQKQNKGSVVETFLRLDAVDANGVRAATVIVPFDNLEGYVKVQGGFVDTDSPKVKKGIKAYLKEHPLSLDRRVYSHLEEEIGPDNKVMRDGHQEEFSPTSTIRMVVSQISSTQKRRVEDIVLRELSEALKAKGLLAGVKTFPDSRLTEGLRNDLSKILNVGKDGYTDFYSVFAHTRFFATVLRDVVGHANPQGLEILKCFEKDGRMNKNGRRMRSYGNSESSEEKAAAVIDSLERIIAKHIKPPYEMFECGVKRPESFANKVLLAKLFPTIKAGYEDGSLNAYLRCRSLPELADRDVTPRDLRDLFRMAWIVHGNSVTYDLRRDYLPTVPEDEEKAQSRVYEAFFSFANIPTELRGSNDRNGRKRGHSGGRTEVQRWRSLGIVETEEGVRINLESLLDVKDYILKRKPNNFAQIKAYAEYSGFGEDVPFEIQLKTNYMDTRNQLGNDASHDMFKRRNAAIIAYCVEKGAITQEKVDATIGIVSNALRAQVHSS